LVTFPVAVRLNIEFGLFSKRVINNEGLLNEKRMTHEAFLDEVRPDPFVQMVFKEHLSTGVDEKINDWLDSLPRLHLIPPDCCFLICSDLLSLKSSDHLPRPSDSTYSSVSLLILIIHAALKRWSPLDNERQ
jgi:hypothetical protein